MVRIYAHRGYCTENAKENSIASLKASRDVGFSSIEFDIWYLNEELVISHDKPSDKEFFNLPRLDDYFCYKNDFTYWLDFKNLNKDNSKEAILLLQKTINANGISVNQLYFAPFITNFSKLLPIISKFREILGYEINVLAVCNEIEIDQKEAFHQTLKDHKINFLSIDHQLIDENFVRIFCDITLFAWTVNGEERLDYLKKLGVENFASDSILPSQINER